MKPNPLSRIGGADISTIVRRHGVRAARPSRIEPRSRLMAVAVLWLIVTTTEGLLAAAPATNGHAADGSTPVISGNVIDQDSKRPIEKFRVIPGFHGGPNRWNWRRRESVGGVNGRYQIHAASAGVAEHLVRFDAVRIEANGYQPAVSRDINPHFPDEACWFGMRFAPYH